MASIRFILTFFIGMLTGIILGISVYTMFVSYKMDTYHNQISELENKIIEKDTQLKKLEKSINTHEYILKNIEVLFNSEEEEIDYIEIEKVIQEKYGSLLGKEIKNIDGDIIGKVIDGRILRLENGNYQILIDKLILSETLKIWVNVKATAE